MLDHCNGYVALDSLYKLLNTDRLGIGRSSQVLPSIS
jgi:hypothetical protein